MARADSCAGIKVSGCDGLPPSGETESGNDLLGDDPLDDRIGEEDTNNNAAIYAGVGVGVALVCIVIVVLVVVRWRKRAARSLSSTTDTDREYDSSTMMSAHSGEFASARFDESDLPRYLKKSSFIRDNDQTDDHYLQTTPGLVTTTSNDAAYVVDKTLIRAGDQTDKHYVGSTVSNKESQPLSGGRTDVPWCIAESDLKFGKVIGEGFFGQVRAECFFYSCYNSDLFTCHQVRKARWRGMFVAVKQLKNANVSPSEEAAFRREAALLFNMQPHVNLVTFYGIAEIADGGLGYVTEYYRNGSLAGALYNPAKTRVNVVWTQLLQLSIVLGAASGVDHLHAQDIVHRDLAARNVLLDRDMTPKVADFGLSRGSGGDAGGTQASYQMVGPVCWMAPEQLDGNTYSKKSDVFSFGVLVYEIFARREPWHGLSPMRASASDIPSLLQPLVNRMWLEDPDATTRHEQYGRRHVCAGRRRRRRR